MIILLHTYEINPGINIFRPDILTCPGLLPIEYLIKSVFCTKQIFKCFSCKRDCNILNTNTLKGLYFPFHGFSLLVKDCQKLESIFKGLWFFCCMEIMLFLAICSLKLCIKIPIDNFLSWRIKCKLLSVFYHCYSTILQFHLFYWDLYGLKITSK